MFLTPLTSTSISQSLARVLQLVLLWTMALSLGLFSALTQAGSLSVSPVLLSMTQAQNNRTITLRNTAATEGYYQLQLFAWSQEDGETRLVPQESLIVTPPLALIAPGASQLARVVRADGNTATDTEGSYRLIISEIPHDLLEQGDAAVNVLLRVSVPVFTQGPADAAPRLQASVTTREGNPHLRLENHGNSHARLTDASLADSQGQLTPWRAGLMGYVLPGSVFYWPLPDTATTATQLSVSINGTATMLALTPSEQTP
ncbi:fimbria/pilus periplasmic chaperone [Alcanivorax sp. JB21]|uniref:fimbrial biogenesis chaperone n=1 Tax=Alcanivorax limicola TaxID=2874102 RepID=UPI001CBEA829|nr:fimbria/pilus periplasmic chaperone [Alcanivorax limicola]MBZ2189784.1 fimbria/pilus periplasmic chaperone [Alcanivorax limicola]